MCDGAAEEEEMIPAVWRPFFSLCVDLMDFGFFLCFSV